MQAKGGVARGRGASDKRDDVDFELLWGEEGVVVHRVAVILVGYFVAAYALELGVVA